MRKLAAVGLMIVAISTGFNDPVQGAQARDYQSSQPLTMNFNEGLQQYLNSPVQGRFNLNYTGFIYGSLSNIDDKNSLAYSISNLSKLPYIICSEPSRLSADSRMVADTIKNTTTKLFGYVHIGRNPDGTMINLEEVTKAIDRIAAAGWHGVFIDQFGYDFGGTRSDQRTVVQYAHDQGLKCFANAWFVEEALGGDSFLGEGDWYLCESFFRSGAEYRSDLNSIDKYIKAMDYSHGRQGEETNLNTRGVQIAGLTFKGPQHGWDDPITSEDIKMSNILAKTLDFKGWWFSDGTLEDNALAYGSEPNIEIGDHFLSYLHKVSGNKYVAETDRYRIEFYGGSRPYMILNPLKADDPRKTFGTPPSEDQVNLHELSTDELKKLQRRINAYGFKDNENNLIDEDGVFGNKSEQGLDNFLEANKYSYFSVSAKAALLGDGAVNVTGGKGTIIPSDTIALDSSVYSEINKHFQRALNALGYTDNNGEKLDEDGYFGAKSMNALNKFLSYNEYAYFGAAASADLMQRAESLLNPVMQLTPKIGQGALKDWTIRLNQAVDQRTVHQNTVYVLDSRNQKVSVTVTIEGDGKSIRVKHPASGYPAGSYTLNITTGLKSTTDKALKQACQMVFTISI